MFCSAYKCMYTIFNKLAVFREDTLPIVRQGMLHDQFVSTLTPRLEIGSGSVSNPVSNTTMNTTCNFCRT